MTTTIEAFLKLHRLISVVLHMAMIGCSTALAFWLRFDGEIPSDYLLFAWQTMPLLLACRVTVFLPFRLFEGLWRYTSLWDLRNIIGGVLSSSALFYAIYWVVDVGRPYPRSILVVDAILLVCMLSAVRLSRRIYREIKQGPRTRKVIIFGAGDAGEMIARDMRQNPEYDALPIGFMDDDPRKTGQRIHGVPVLGTRHHATEILQKHRPDEVLIAVPSADADQLRGIVRALDRSKVRITTLPNLREMIGRPVGVGQIRPLQVEDLLARAPVDLNPEPLWALLHGRRVLITGAGGSIGSEICRQVAALDPSHLVALDRYENSLFETLNGITAAHPHVRVHGVIADVTDRRRIEAVFAEHKPEIVFHAAAHKHVPLMEMNPCEAVKNNVGGSRVLAEIAQRRGVRRFVLISTDKAVNPTSVMGATKRVAELTTRALSERGDTNFVTVRFGNVLGSNGSVVPTFLEQIRKGGPVTVTHPKMRRYFMLIPEAVQLVLHAATLEERGCAYVLEMGEQVSLLDMARDLIRLSGYIPEDEIPIRFIGLRPGEKLYEELVGSDEAAEPSPIDKILRLNATTPHPMNGQLLRAVADLERAAADGDTDLVFHHLCRLVPNFSPTRQLASA